MLTEIISLWFKEPTSQAPIVGRHCAGVRSGARRCRALFTRTGEKSAANAEALAGRESKPVPTTWQIYYDRNEWLMSWTYAGSKMSEHTDAAAIL